MVVFLFLETRAPCRVLIYSFIPKSVLTTSFYHSSFLLSSRRLAVLMVVTVLCVLGHNGAQETRSPTSSHFLRETHGFFFMPPALLFSRCLPFFFPFIPCSSSCHVSIPLRLPKAPLHSAPWAIHAQRQQFTCRPTDSQPVITFVLPLVTPHIAADAARP